MLYEGLSNPLWLGENDVELVQEAPTASKPDHRLKPGDKVRVKSREFCESLISFVSPMASFCDCIVTIAHQSTPTFYRIEEDDQQWNWDIEAFDLEEAPQKPNYGLTAKIRSVFSGGSEPAFKDNLPLIKTTRLLTNIKLD